MHVLANTNTKIAEWSMENMLIKLTGFQLTLPINLEDIQTAEYFAKELQSRGEIK